MRNIFRRCLYRILRLFFTQLYNRYAWSYDPVAWGVSLGNWLNWVSCVVEELPGPEVLELGHGPGHLQTMLTRKGVHITGIDLSLQMGRIAARKLRRLNMDFRLVRCEAQRLPFRDGTFHQVAATFPSEYIYDAHTLEESQRVLFPGGKLVVLPVAWITGENWLERLAAWLFKITGQAPTADSKMMKPFKDASFSIQLKRIKGDNWEVLIIIAEKPLVPTRQN